MTTIQVDLKLIESGASSVGHYFPSHLPLLGQLLSVCIVCESCMLASGSCYVIITRLLKDNLKCLVNKQPKIEDKKK